MIKNLIIGYIKVSHAQEKKQVLRLIATMLNFSPVEIEQAESTAVLETKWFGLLKTSPNKSSPSKSSESSGSSSFADLLIQYVDRESKPKANITFDFNDPVLGAKKTDNPVPSLLLDERKIDLASSESAIKFFNNSVGGDLQLINRTSSSQQSQESQSSKLNNSISSNVSNSILEQILK